MCEVQQITTSGVQYTMYVNKEVPIQPHKLIDPV